MPDDAGLIQSPRLPFLPIPPGKTGFLRKMPVQQFLVLCPRQANLCRTALIPGAGIGVVQQLLLVWIFLLLLPVFSLTPIGDTLYETVQQGVLLEYLYQHNLLLLMGVLLLAKI